MLVGRSGERAEVDALLRSAIDGRGGGLVLRGEPGIGKTALLDYAFEHAGVMRVLRARGVEAEAELAFSGLYELLRPVMSFTREIPKRQAAALEGAFGLGQPVDSRLLIGAGALSLLAAAAEEQPVLCLIDDAHWLDAASTDALAFAVRRLGADSVAVLFATREGEPAFDPVGIPKLTLAALQRDEAVELLRGSGLPQRVVEDLHRAATGNPLALLELPAALTEKQRNGQEPLPEPLPVTKSIESAYARRILALPESSRRALAVAAAEPSREVSLIDQACASVGVGAEALGAAEDAGLVRVVDARVLFEHPLVRAAAYRAIPAADRRAAHAALAAAYATGDTARQAWHLAEAATGPDEEAAAALESAALAVYARSGYRSAAMMLERAAALTATGARRAERLYFAAILNFYGHGIARALTLLDEAETAETAETARTRYRLLRLALWYYRDPRRASALLLEEARRLDTDDPEHAVLAAGFAACFRAHLRDADGAREAAELTRELAGHVSGHVGTFAAVAAGTGFVAAGSLDASAGLRDAATELFRAREWRYEAPTDWTRGYTGVYAGAALVLLGEHQTLRERVASLSAEFVPGDEVSLMLALGIVGTAEFLAGRWSEARAAVGQSLQLAGEIGWLGPQVHAYRRVLGHIAAAQGSETEIEAQQELDDRYADVEWAGLIASGARPLLALGRRDYAAAAERYETDVLPLVGPLVLYTDVADALEAYVHAGRVDEAAEWLERFGGQARESGWPWALAATAHLEAVFPGKDDPEERFATALEWHGRARQPFRRARTELAYGEWLRRSGRRRDAREHLRSALTTFERLGARPWADQAAAQLRATGGRVLAHLTPDTANLTPQELQVALVVARGATNKEAAAELFLSPKTIEKHLGAAYGKLGVRGRGDLARVFASQEAESALVGVP
jgi:DNA-binding CsgD family transcriptional regulator